jgi:hypothetical protein
MKAKQPERTYELVPAGNHFARLYSIVHIGTNSFEYMRETKKSDKVRLTFELSNERKVFKEGEEAKPFSISREFGLTMGQKSNLRPFVESFIGTSLSDEEAYGFDLEDLLKIPCLLNVVHAEKGDKVFANIKSATPLPKGMEAPVPVNAHSIVDVDTSSFDEIEKLPDFLKEKIKSSEEYKARVSGVVQERLGNNTETDAAGAQPAKPIRPKILGGPVTHEGEYPQEDINPNDIPF